MEDGRMSRYGIALLVMAAGETLIGMFARASVIPYLLGCALLGVAMAMARDAGRRE